MTKKTLKRMTLSRETLHTLAEETLETAKGGDTCNASRSCPPPPTGNNELSCLC